MMNVDIFLEWCTSTSSHPGSPGKISSSSKYQVNTGCGWESTIPSKKTRAPSSTAFPSILVTNRGAHGAFGPILRGSFGGKYIWFLERTVLSLIYLSPRPLGEEVLPVLLGVHLLVDVVIPHRLVVIHLERAAVAVPVACFLLLPTGMAGSQRSSSLNSLYLSILLFLHDPMNNDFGCSAMA